MITYTMAVDPPLWKVFKNVGVDSKSDWVIHDPSRIMKKGKRQMIAVTGKAQEDGYDCGIETWWRFKKGKGMENRAVHSTREAELGW